MQELNVLQRLDLTKSKTPSRFNMHTIVWSILLFITGRIVGNRSDAAFLQLWDALMQSGAANQLLCVTLGGAVMISFSMIWL